MTNIEIEKIIKICSNNGIKFYESSSYDMSGFQTYLLTITTKDRNIVKEILEIYQMNFSYDRIEYCLSYSYNGHNALKSLP